MNKNEGRSGMPLYFAPMEGLTGYTFRGLHHAMFPGADRYYAPFVSVGKECTLQNREKTDIDPANNAGIPLIPQVLTNQPDAFLWACRFMAALSYEEVNLNLGCPSNTVTARRKGAGFLADPDALDRFFERVFDGLALWRQEEGRAVRISVKTRAGVRESSESGALCALYNRYPISEVIVHPRVQKQMYGEEADLECFAGFLESSIHPVVYNGDIRTVEDYRRILRLFGERTISGIMIGRGLLANPALIREIRAQVHSPAPAEQSAAASRGNAADAGCGGIAGCAGGSGRESADGRMTLPELIAWHEALLQDYALRLSGEQHVLHKMKEMWSYLGARFEGGSPYVHKILMAKRMDEYRNAVRRLCAECRMQ